MHASWTSPPIGFVTARRKPPDELSDRPLYREFRATGRFWLPGAEEETWWGQVLFRPGADVLIILDDPPWQSSPREGIAVPLLHGRLSDGASCTILDGRAYVETYFRERQYHRATIFSRFFLGGLHSDGASGRQITELACQFTHLNEWFGSPYDLKHKEDWARSEVHFQPSEFTLQLESHGVPFELLSGCNRSVPFGMGPRGGNWSYDYYLSIRPKSPQTLLWFLSTAATVRRCMIFLIGCAVYTTDTIPSFLDHGTEDGSSRSIGFLLLGVDVPSLIQSDAHYFSTRYADVAKILPHVVKAWFEQAEKLNVVTSIYARTLLNDGASEESIFLGVVQTLEHFHAILFPKKSTHFEHRAWKAFLSGLRRYVPQALVDAGALSPPQGQEKGQLLVDRIGSLNKVSLQTKLGNLLQGISLSQLMPLLDNPRDPEQTLKEFPKKVADMRHFLTHYDKRQAGKTFSETGLRRATSSYWAVLTYWLARQLGIGEKLAGDMAYQAKRAMFVTAQNRGL